MILILASVSFILPMKVHTQSFFFIFWPAGMCTFLWAVPRQASFASNFPPFCVLQWSHSGMAVVPTSFIGGLQTGLVLQWKHLWKWHSSHVSLMRFVSMTMCFCSFYVIVSFCRNIWHCLWCLKTRSLQNCNKIS